MTCPQMKIIIYLLFLIVFSFDILLREGVISRSIAMVPEVLSLTTCVMILVRVSRTKQLLIHPKYVIIFGLFATIAILGIILNHVPAGAIFAGIREYFKYFPFFLVPAAFEFSEQEINRQLKIVLGLALLQLPVVVYQRFVEFAGDLSGDNMRGTLNDSGTLSIVLLSVMAVVISFYLRKHLNRSVVLGILLILFLPTTLNETKVTLFLLPLVLIMPAYMTAKGFGRVKKVLPMIGMGMILMIGFVGIYNQYYRTSGETIGKFVENRGVESYLFRGAKRGKIQNGALREIGRFDAIVLGFEHISSDIIKLIFGVGIGNLYQGTFGKIWRTFDGSE